MMRKAKSQTQNFKIAKAALFLAAKTNWPQITLEAIAKRAKIPLATFKKRFSGTHEIVPLIVSEITCEALAKTKITPGSPRDVLFDLIMARFDIMQKDRKAILSINDAICCDPALSCALVRAILDDMGKTFDATKFDTSLRPLLVIKLIAIYSWTFIAWSKDDTRDMSQTMAALDRALLLDEKTMQMFKQHF